MLLASQSLDKTRWDQIALAMLNYGCVEKWPKDMVERKWFEMYPAGDYGSEYESPRFKRRMTEDYGIDGFSDGRSSLSHSLNESDHPVLTPSLSNTMNDTRSRTGSISSSHWSVEQQIAHHLSLELQEEPKW